MEGAGGTIQYSVGMELDQEQEELWSSYTEGNKETFFWLFLNTFVEKWEKQVRNQMRRVKISHRQA
jgi:hypothetical protein